MRLDALDDAILSTQVVDLQRRSRRPFVKTHVLARREQILDVRLGNGAERIEGEHSGGFGAASS